MKREFPKVCHHCGKRFLAWREDSKFCSNKCTNLHRKGRVTYKKRVKEIKKFKPLDNTPIKEVFIYNSF